MIRKIMPELAAAMMGKAPQFIRVGLQRNLLPFGNAVPVGKAGPRPRYSYYISPALFMAYTGFTEEEIKEAAAKGGYAL